jgi:hypothetical protein
VVAGRKGGGVGKISVEIKLILSFPNPTAKKALINKRSCTSHRVNTSDRTGANTRPVGIKNRKNSRTYYVLNSRTFTGACHQQKIPKQGISG